MSQSKKSQDKNVFYVLESWTKKPQPGDLMKAGQTVTRHTERHSS